MGGRGNSRRNPPKRDLSEDEISPDSKRKEKVTKMVLSDTDLENLVANVAAIMKNTETMNANIDEIKLSQNKLAESFNNMHVRVTDLEKKVDDLRESREIEVLRHELKVIKGQFHALEQSGANNKLFVRNLPLEVIENEETTENVIKSIMNVIGMPHAYYEAEPRKAPNNQTANVLLTFATDATKSKVMRKFKALKNDKARGSALLVEKHITLARDHTLNGVKVSMANKLTAFNAQLIKEARKFAPSHFEYVFDSPEGLIKVKITNDTSPVTIRCEEDLRKLVEKIENDRRKQPHSSARTSPITTRANAARGGRK